MRHFKLLAIFLSGIACVTPKLIAQEVSEEELRGKGAQIYADSCADCHGTQGEGVDGAYEDALVGDDSIRQLARIVSDTMPEGEPEACVAEDALAVASFMHYEFYSEAAQVRNRPPRIEMARLTASQLRQSMSDLFSRFYGTPSPKPLAEIEYGVKAEYFEGDRWDRKTRKLERIDAQINFDFGRESPVDGIDPKEFSILWEGGLLVKESGRYEIVMDSTCSFLFYFGNSERELINNYVQSGDKTEFRRELNLTAGRVYPFRIKFRQRGRKTELPPASIVLKWVPPGGLEEVIPAQNLIAERVPPAFALQADLPPDDRTYGYERGIAVSREWDESTTSAALEFAQIAFEELWPKYRREHRDVEERQALAGFLVEVLETAFRRKLSDGQRSLFVDKQLAAEPDNALAIKRVCLVGLKSPSFLYPLADMSLTQSERVANRLALVLFDSLPSDANLRRLVESGKFESESQVRHYAQKYIEDFRVRAKTRQFLHGWLNMEHIQEIAKDPEQFPGFDEELVNDLHKSLNAFLDHVVWSEQSDYRQLFLSPVSFTTERIGEYYGGSWQAAKNGDSPASPPGSLSLTAISETPMGVVHHPFMLSGLSYYETTSPIHRGIFLLRYMLGRSLRPPADAFSPLSPDLHPNLTTRERVQLQTSPESCQVCHSKINSLGFTLEAYDAVGRNRTEERGKPIDATGAYISRDGAEVRFSDSYELAKYLAESDDAQRAFVARAFQYFVKQPPAAYGADTLDRLTKQFQRDDCNIKNLLVEIAVTASTPVLESDYIASRAKGDINE